MTRTPQPQPTLEEIAEQIVENWMANWDQDDDPLKQAILEALRNERERCAKLADGFARRLRTVGPHSVAAGVEVLAKEIREGR